MTEILSTRNLVRFTLLICAFAIVAEAIPHAYHLFEKNSEPARPQTPNLPSEPTKGAPNPVESQDTNWLFSILMTSLAVIVVALSMCAIFCVPDPNRFLDQAREERQKAKLELEEAVEVKRIAEDLDKSSAERLSTAEGMQKSAKHTVKKHKNLKLELAKLVDEAKKQIAEAEAMKIRCDELGGNFESREKECRQREIALEKAYEQLERKQQDAAKADAVIEIAQQHKREAETQIESAKKEQAQANLKIAESNALIQELEDARKTQAVEKAAIDAKQAESNATLMAAVEERKRAEGDLEVATRLRSEAAGLSATATKLHASFQEYRQRCFPTWLTSNPLRPKIDQLEELSKSGNANAGLLLSYLQVYQSILSHTDLNREFNYLWPTVREIGRFLALTLKSTGENAEMTQAQLLEWAIEINRESGERFRLYVPTIDEAFDPSRMESKGGSIQKVSDVFNWAIINPRARSITQTKSEVS